MTNQLDDIYNMLFEKLKIVPLVKWVELDAGQIENADNKLPIEYPVVLISFDDIIWRRRDDGVDEGTLNISLKVGVEFVIEKDFLKNDEVRKEVTDCLTLIQGVHDAVNDQHTSSCSKLRKYNQFHLKGNYSKPMWVHVLQYQCNIQSNGAIDDDDALVVDYDNVKNNNSFLERRKMSLVHK